MISDQQEQIFTSQNSQQFMKNEEPADQPKELGLQNETDSKDAKIEQDNEQPGSEVDNLQNQLQSELLENQNFIVEKEEQNGQPQLDQQEAFHQSIIEEEEEKVPVQQMQEQTKEQEQNQNDLNILESIQNDPNGKQLLIKMSYLHLFRYYKFKKQILLHRSIKQIGDELRNKYVQLRDIDDETRDAIEYQIQLIDSKLEDMKMALKNDTLNHEQHQQNIYRIVDDIQNLLMPSEQIQNQQTGAFNLYIQQSICIIYYQGMIQRILLLIQNSSLCSQIRSKGYPKKRRNKKGKEVYDISFIFIIKARLQKSKQAFSVFKKWIILIFVAIHGFLKNPDNIAKCFVLAVSCFFVSSYMSIPDMSNRQQLYFLDWLAYNRSSRSVLFSGALCVISLEWYLIYIIWVFFIGFRTDSENKKLKLLLNECNPGTILQFDQYKVFKLSLLFMTDNDLINNKFDFAVWFCNVFFYCTLRVYYVSSLDIIKKTLQNITPENLKKIQIMNQINIFSCIVLVINLVYTFSGIFCFHKVGFYATTLLFFGGLEATVQYIKIYLMTNSLQNQYHYYINNNIDIINEPFFDQELFSDVSLHLLNGIYNLILISNYFKTVSLQFVLHLWLFYILGELQTSISALKKLYDLYQRSNKIKTNLEAFFPRTDPSLIEPDEICTICHDELIVSRSLPCGHKFHLKCLFNWLKNQQHCPMCRQVVNNIENQANQTTPLLGRILQMITNITLFNITILFMAPRINENAQQGAQEEFQQAQAQEFIQQQPQQQPQQQLQQQEQAQQQPQQQPLQQPQIEPQQLSQYQQEQTNLQPEKVEQKQKQSIQQQEYIEKQQYIELKQEESSELDQFIKKLNFQDDQNDKVSESYFEKSFEETCNQNSETPLSSQINTSPDDVRNE